MATKESTEQAPEETTEATPAPADGHRGRLVLATGEIVSVPAESVSVATEHHSANLGASVPVASRFVLAE